MNLISQADQSGTVVEVLVEDRKPVSIDMVSTILVLLQVKLMFSTNSGLFILIIFVFLSQPLLVIVPWTCCRCPITGYLQLLFLSKFATNFHTVIKCVFLLVVTVITRCATRKMTEKDFRKFGTFCHVTNEMRPRHGIGQSLDAPFSGFRGKPCFIELNIWNDQRLAIFLTIEDDSN